MPAETKITQEMVDAAKLDALMLAPTDKQKELEDDFKARENYPLGAQLRYATRVAETFEDVAIDAKYRPTPVGQSGNNGRKVDPSNPWSAAGWNITEQGRIAKTLTDAKAKSMAKAAGCVIGSTKPNPLFN